MERIYDQRQPAAPERNPQQRAVYRPDHLQSATLRERSRNGQANRSSQLRARMDNEGSPWTSHRRRRSMAAGARDQAAILVAVGQQAAEQKTTAFWSHQM